MTAEDDIWVGLDLGTQGARAMAVTAGGHVAASASRPLTSHRDGPRHEQDPHEWWAALADACRAALAGVAPDAVRGVALCGTSGTILLVDGEGRPLTNGIMYDDARAAAHAERVNAVGGDVWERLGYSRMQPSWALPKLLWLLEHAEDASRARLAHQPDVVTRELLGRPAPSDSSHALKSGYDVLTEGWPHATLEALGVVADVLPEVVRSGTPLGTVCAAASEATGLPVGTPVVAGMTDGCAAQLGAGALATGSWNSVLGTTLVVKGVTRELLHDPAGALYSHRSPEDGWLPGGASSVGAGVLAAHYAGCDLEALDRKACERGPTDVVAYPLVARGERFPFLAPDAEGFLAGEPVDEIGHYAALLQGVAYVERLIFDYVDLLGARVRGALTLTGGGARSRYWCQLRADVLGRPVRIPVNAEAGVGMAVLAASSVGGRPLREIAAEMVKTGEELTPRPALSEGHLKSYINLVDELERRRWLRSDVADHARRRAAL